jgi:CRP-like cAMP-binding protein
VKDQQIFFADQPSNAIYFLKKGRVKIATTSEEGKEIVKAVLFPGEVFGELAIAGEEMRHDRAVALDDDVIICSMDLADAQLMLGRDPRFHMAFTRLIGQRMIGLERRLENLVFKDSRSRIIALLRNMAMAHGRKVGHEVQLDHSLTHQDIADLTATSRQTVTTVLSDLQKTGPGTHGTATAPTAAAKKAERLPVMKTYKIFIGGKFPRTESGRYYQPKGSDGKPLANVCRSSRKDVRDAVVAARGAVGGWAGRSAFNRSQILYRIGEMLEGRSAQFVHELVLHGATQKQAEAEVAAAIDLWIHYAGWCDKYQALFSSVNPTNSSHFNFSVYEPTGVVGIMSGGSNGLLELVSLIAPVITGGNTCRGGGQREAPAAGRHLHRSAGHQRPARRRGEPDDRLPQRTAEASGNAHGHERRRCCDASKEERTMLETEATCNLKRVVYPKSDAGSPYAIHDLDTQEVKTTWHPIERGQGGGGGY